jgi:peroxiredoxin
MNPVLLPKRGQPLPELAGAAVDGTKIRISDFRGRKNIVLVFSGRESTGRGQELIRALGARYGEIQEETAEIVLVVAGPIDEARRLESDAQLPFPILADEHNKLHRAIGAVEIGEDHDEPVAAVCIADRYGDVYFAQLCSDAACSSAEDILDWLEFIEIQCPECGVSEWPEAAA